METVADLVIALTIGDKNNKILNSLQNPVLTAGLAVLL